MQFDKEHLKQFIGSIDSDEHIPDNASSVPNVWFDDLKIDEPIPPLPADRVTRSEIFKMALDKTKYTTLVLCVTIMAWGGMHRKSGKTLFFKPEELLSVCDKIRDGQFTRKDAFNELIKLQQGGQIKGMGPAYFTKLIFFLMPPNDKNGPQGYIMDQWVACSINLLLEGDDIVLMDRHFHWKRYKTGNKNLKETATFQVSICNTADHYENFCQSIEKLCCEVNLQKNTQYFPSQIEFMLLSKGGKESKRKKWRKYVIEHRSHGMMSTRTA